MRGGGDTEEEAGQQLSRERGGAVAGARRGGRGGGVARAAPAPLRRWAGGGGRSQHGARGGAGPGGEGSAAPGRAVARSGLPPMEPARRGSTDQGSAASLGPRPGPPRGSAPAASPPSRPVTFGPGSSVRPQPDGGAPAAPFLGGGVPGARRSSRPDASCDPFPYGCPRPGEAQRGGPEERALGRAAQPLSLEVGRAQPEGAGGPHAFPLPPSPGVSPARSAALSPVAPGRPAFPELGSLEHAAPGKPVPAERRETLPKAESSDHISAWAGSSPRATILPKAVSSEFIASGRVGLSKPAALSKPEPEELSLFGRSLGLPSPSDSCNTLLGCSGRVPEDGSFW